MRIATMAAIRAIAVGLALDAEPDRRIAERIAGGTIGDARAGDGATSENGAATFADVGAVPVGQALDAAVTGGVANAPIEPRAIGVGRALDALSGDQVAARRTTAAADRVDRATSTAARGPIADGLFDRALIICRADAAIRSRAADEVAGRVAASREADGQKDGRPPNRTRSRPSLR